MNLSNFTNHSLRTIALGLLTAIVIVLGVSSRLIRSASADSAASKQTLSAPSKSTAGEITARYGRLPLSFEENEGQTDGEVRFLSRGPGYDLFLTADGAVLSLRKTTTPIEDSKLPAPANTANPATAQVSILRLKMIGANSNASVAGEEELPGKINYLIGNVLSNGMQIFRPIAECNTRRYFPASTWCITGTSNNLSTIL